MISFHYLTAPVLYALPLDYILFQLVFVWRCEAPGDSSEQA